MLFQMSLRTDASFQLSYGFYTKFLFSNLPNNKCFIETLLKYHIIIWTSLVTAI